MAEEGRSSAEFSKLYVPLSYSWSSRMLNGGGSKGSMNSNLYFRYPCEIYSDFSRRTLFFVKLCEAKIICSSLALISYVHVIALFRKKRQISKLSTCSFFFFFFNVQGCNTLILGSWTHSLSQGLRERKEVMFKK